MERPEIVGQPSSKGPVAETHDTSTPGTSKDAQLQECLELLRGPGDERKYVDQNAHAKIIFINLLMSAYSPLFLYCLNHKA